MSSANLFGTFLDAFNTSSAARKADLAGLTVPSTTMPTMAPAVPAPVEPTPAQALELGELAAAVGRLVAPVAVDAVLKVLLAGPRDFKDLVPIAGNSVGVLLQVLDKVVAAGWVAYNADKRVVLTDQGEQIARLIG